ncbi:MAG TPA: 50S ribosomal protein L19e [Geobacterales bacterium]|nr:50S ribosomal protein L19e [Geobacterales bacterium]
MSLKYIRELASKITGAGESRIYIDPEYYDRLSTVISRQEVKKLIEDGIIKVKPKKGQVWKEEKIRKRRQRRGPGSKKGKRSKVRKEEYVLRVRGLRRFLRQLYDKGAMDSQTYRTLRLLIKSGTIRSKARIKSYLEQLKQRSS